LFVVACAGLSEGALIMKSFSYGEIYAKTMIHEFRTPCDVREIKFGEAGDPAALAAKIVDDCKSGDAAAVEQNIKKSIEMQIEWGQGPQESFTYDASGAKNGKGKELNPWSDPIQDCIDAGLFCGGGGCFDTDASLFEDMRAIAKARHRELITLHTKASYVKRELLNDPTSEIHDAIAQTLELFRSETRPDFSKPWETYPVRMATGETLKFLEYHAGETAPNGMDYTALANRLRWRAAFRVRIWTDPLQSPDTFNSELWAIRPENHVPFPPRGTWPYCDSALDALEANWEGLFDEYKTLNNGNLLHGKHLEEHEQGLQQYAFNTSMWFRSTFWRAGTCRNGAFKFSCALFQKLQDAWKPCVPLARSPGPVPSHSSSSTHSRTHSLAHALTHSYYVPRWP